MKIIHNHYSNIPCQGRNCIHWGGEYEESRFHKAGYDVLGLGKWHEDALSIWHCEYCKKSSELADIRKEIYDRAQKASDKVYEEHKYKNIGNLMKKAHESFDNIANEWRNIKCPFYQVFNDSENQCDIGV